MARYIALRIKKEKSEKVGERSKTLPYEGVRNISFFMHGDH